MQPGFLSLFPGVFLSVSVEFAEFGLRTSRRASLGAFFWRVFPSFMLGFNRVSPEFRLPFSVFVLFVSGFLWVSCFFLSCFVLGS